MLQVNVTVDSIPGGVFGTVAQLTMGPIEAQCDFAEKATSCVIKVAIPASQRRVWTPADPNLYNFTVTLSCPDTGPGHNSAVLDTVQSYAALRTVGTLEKRRFSTET